jgi:hypothetical protein
MTVTESRSADRKKVRFQPPKAWDPEAKWTQDCVMFRVCGEKHPPGKCDAFKKLSPQQRLKEIDNRELCRLCYRHLRGRDCWSKDKVPNCGVDGCEAAHHHLLHGAHVEGCVMVVQGIGAGKAKVFLCREDIRVEGAGKASRLHALYDWGATVTLVTHAAAVKAGLEQKRQTPAAIAGLGGQCTMVDSYYMVPVIDGNDKVRVVKALGVDHITTLAASEVTEDIVTRLPRTKGFVEKLARLAGDVEMLVGMDNQGWMPMHMESSRVEGDNLRLMQSVLSLRCILMGSARAPDQGSDTQGSAVGPPQAFRRPRGRRPGPQPLSSLRVMTTMMLFMLAVLPECAAFRAYDCNNQSSQIEQYSLLNPEPCGNMEKVHAIERELYGEIIQIKKERLVQVTRCTATQTIKSVYCGFQSRSGPERYAQFHDPIVIEQADCRMAAKTGRFKLNGKDYPFEMNVRRAIIVDLVGGLDNDGNCEVGLNEVNGVPLRNQMATAMYEIYIRQEWARANDLTGTIKLSEYLMGTTRDRTLVDSGEGTYVWDHSQDACPDTLVSMYRGRIKVLTNSNSFLHGRHSHRSRQR